MAPLTALVLFWHPVGKAEQFPTLLAVVMVDSKQLFFAGSQTAIILLPLFVGTYVLRWLVLILDAGVLPIMVVAELSWGICTILLHFLQV